MLTFETTSVQGAGAITEKLEVCFSGASMARVAISGAMREY